MNTTSTATAQVTQSSSYNALKTYQQEFIRMIALWCTHNGYPANVAVPCPTAFSRDVLRTIANGNGMRWAPAWIVKDVTRKAARGYYSVPEVADYMATMTAPATDATEV
ncbi:MAG: hypothetical protein EBY29_02890 [Planctomycetes bacterium]|nr:hypothetical protein [Planctomycetota bacterium]